MKDNVHQYYTDAPYIEQAHTSTHPAALSCIAKLWGLNPVPANESKILELACGAGDNLIHMAESLPGAQCLGNDIVEPAIAKAKQKAQAKGLKNITFEAGNLLHMDLGDQKFDYIIVHGALTWVPEDVQERIFEICKNHLTERGLAMISYAVLPGVSGREALRSLFLLETEALGEEQDNPQKRLKTFTDILTFFEKTSPEFKENPRTNALWADLNALRNKEKNILMFDEGGPLFDPLYFLQFTEWAAENDLAYVADARIINDWLGYHSEKTLKEIALRGMSRLKAVQYLDYLTNTPFRQSIVAPATQAANIRTHPATQILSTFYVHSFLRPMGDWNRLKKNRAMQFEAVNLPSPSKKHEHAQITVKDAIAKKMLVCLWENREQALTIQQAWEAIGGHQQEEYPYEKMAHLLLRCMAMNMITVNERPIQMSQKKPS